MKGLTTQRLCEVFRYDPETGHVYWKISTSRRVKPGDKAGSLSKRGYYHVCLDGKFLLIHRLAFVLMGEEVPDFVDHINRVSTDNRWSNLRGVSHQENCTNNTARGTYKIGNKYRAKIFTKGKAFHLGTFDTEEEAHQAYIRAKKQFHPIWSADGTQV